MSEVERQAAPPLPPSLPPWGARLLTVGIIAYVLLRAVECSKLIGAATEFSEQILWGMMVGFVFVAAFAFTVGAAWRRNIDGATLCHWLVELMVLPMSVNVGFTIASRWPAGDLSDLLIKAVSIGIALLVQAAFSWLGHKLIQQFSGR